MYWFWQFSKRFSVLIEFFSVSRFWMIFYTVFLSVFPTDDIKKPALQMKTRTLSIFGERDIIFKNINAYTDEWSEPGLFY